MKFPPFFFLATMMCLGCGSDDEAFLPLDKLCPAVAETVCEARKGCCDVGDDVSGCEADVQSACDSERAGLTKENGLSYDGENAASVHDSLRDQVRSCDPAFSLARFFDGGKAAGVACARDSECKDGLCRDDRCAKAQPAPLCTGDDET